MNMEKGDAWLLTARRQMETDPEVKGELEGSLAQVRQSRQPQPGPDTR